VGLAEVQTKWMVPEYRVEKAMIKIISKEDLEGVVHNWLFGVWRYQNSEFGDQCHVYRRLRE